MKSKAKSNILGKTRYLHCFLIAAVIICTGLACLGADIHDAVRNGDIETVKKLVGDHPKLVNAVDDKGETPLYYAAEHDYLSLAEFLVKNHADINAKDKSGATPLDCAIDWDYKDMIALLRQTGADDGGRKEISKSEIEQPKSEKPESEQPKPENLKVPTLPGDDALSPLIFRLTKDGDIEKVNSLLKTDPGLASLRDNSGNTPLHIAARFDRLEIMKVLLTAKSSIDATNNAGETPFLWACVTGDCDAISLLLNNRADPLKRTNEGATSLMLALINKGHSKAARLLIDRGVDINAMAATGETALSCAIEADDLDALNVLLEKKVFILEPTPSRRLALTTALNVAADARIKDALFKSLEVERESGVTKSGITAEDLSPGLIETKIRGGSAKLSGIFLNGRIELVDKVSVSYRRRIAGITQVVDYSLNAQPTQDSGYLRMSKDGDALSGLQTDGSPLALIVTGTVNRIGTSNGNIRTKIIGVATRSDGNILDGWLIGRNDSTSEEQAASRSMLPQGAILIGGAQKERVPADSPSFLIQKDFSLKMGGQ